jgi:hypothetical protein
MAQRCKHCGKKYGNQLASCPHCTRLGNIEINFEGSYAIGVKKILQEILDDIRQRLPDEDAFKTNGIIFLSSPEEILKRDRLTEVGPQFMESMKQLDEKLKLAHVQCRDLVCLAKILFESGFPDGVSFPAVKTEFLKHKSVRHIGFEIYIVVDQRMLFRSDDYVKGVIAHEIVEFSTKFNVWKEHLDEIKGSGDLQRLAEKHLKSGYFPPSKEYDEHEEIVNKEAKRLGFEKEISIMEKGEISTDNIRSDSEIAEIEDFIRKKQKVKTF